MNLAIHKNTLGMLTIKSFEITQPSTTGKDIGSGVAVISEYTE